VSREAADDVSLVAQTLLGPAQLEAQLGQVGAAAVTAQGGPHVVAALVSAAAKVEIECTAAIPK